MISYIIHMLHLLIMQSTSSLHIVSIKII